MVGVIAHAVGRLAAALTCMMFFRDSCLNFKFICIAPQYSWWYHLLHAKTGISQLSTRLELRQRERDTSDDGSMVYHDDKVVLLVQRGLASWAMFCSLLPPTVELIH